MTLRHLRIFITVYQQQSITKAAAELNMTQPAVTRAIQELEEHYGRPLFERIHRRIYVTEAGRQLYQQAVHVKALMDKMEKDMTDWEEAGVLRVGAGTTLGCVLLPRVLSAFAKAHPRLRVHSTVTDTTRLQEMLLHNEIDFALIEGAPADPSLERLPIGKDRMVLILPKEHPLCARESITIPDLAEYPVIVSESGSASRNFLEHLFSIHGLRLNPVMESGSMPAIVRAVQAGLGVSLIPQRMVSLFGEPGGLRERPLSYEILTRESHLVWHESKYIGKSAREFMELVKACGEEVLK